MNGAARRGPLITLATAPISGVAVLVNPYSVKHLANATVYTTGKNAVATVALLPAAGAVGARGRRAVRRPTTPAGWAGPAAIAVIGGSVPFALFFEGLARASSGPVQAQFIQKTLVVWVALLAVPLLAERLGALQPAAIGLLVAGQTALSGGLHRIADLSFGPGEVMILAATLLWAVEVVIAKRILRQVGSWSVALARMVAGSVLLVGWVLVRGDGAQLTGMTAQQYTWILVTGGILAGYVATWFAALALAPAVDVTAILVAAAPITAILQATVQGTALSPQADGLALITANCAPILARRTAAPAVG